MTSLKANHLHRRDVGIAVTDEDHSFEGYWSFVHFYPFVDGAIVPIVYHALVDPEKELSFGRVVDCDPCQIATPSSS